VRIGEEIEKDEEQFWEDSVRCDVLFAGGPIWMKVSEEEVGR
jgi:hypothetical protein